jgi:hypothetical protein
MEQDQQKKVALFRFAVLGDALQRLESRCRKSESDDPF